MSELWCICLSERNVLRKMLASIITFSWVIWHWGMYRCDITMRSESFPSNSNTVIKDRNMFMRFWSTLLNAIWSCIETCHKNNFYHFILRKVLFSSKVKWHDRLFWRCSDKGCLWDEVEFLILEAVVAYKETYLFTFINSRGN